MMHKKSRECQLSICLFCTLLCTPEYTYRSEIMSAGLQMAIPRPFYSGKDACFQGYGFMNSPVSSFHGRSSGLKNPKSIWISSCLLSIPDDDRRGEAGLGNFRLRQGAEFRDCSGVFMKSISEGRLGDHTNFWNAKGTAE